MADETMHDWSLEQIEVDWTNSSALLVVESSDSFYHVVVRGMYEFSVTLEDFWGPSISILEAKGPIQCGNNVAFSLEMQSGDLIKFEAKEIKIIKVEHDSKSASSRPFDASGISFRIAWESKTMVSSPKAESSSKSLRRMRLSKYQQVTVSNDIQNINPWILFGSDRRIRILETKSGDRIEIEESHSH